MVETQDAEAATKTLRIQALHLRLSESDDLDARFPPEFGRIELVIGALEVEGTIRLASRDLDITARSLTAIGDTPALIDTSGAAAEPSFDIEAPGPDGTPQSPHGQEGARGGDGGRGGEITLAVVELHGSLELHTNGTAGGNGQRGGNGVQPATPASVNARWKSADRTRGGVHGGGYLGYHHTAAHVSWARGKNGGNALAGGNGGAPGWPGRGGDAGAVHVTLGDNSPVAPDAVEVAAVGGDAGATGTPGVGGPPGKPGLGGRNRVHWKFVNQFEDWADSSDQWISLYARDYKVTPRAPGGKTTTNAGTGGSPEPRVSEAGRSTDPISESVPAAQIEALLPASLVALEQAQPNTPTPVV